MTENKEDVLDVEDKDYVLDRMIKAFGTYPLPNKSCNEKGIPRLLFRDVKTQDFLVAYGDILLNDDVFVMSRIEKDAWNKLKPRTQRKIMKRLKKTSFFIVKCIHGKEGEKAIKYLFDEIKRQEDEENDKR